jgi:hypothetical protein
MKMFPLYEEPNENWYKINLNYNLHIDANFFRLNTGSVLQGIENKTKLDVIKRRQKIKYSFCTR